MYDNRSDTAIDTVTQSVQSLYTPKHKIGTYPELVAGPIKTVTQSVGIAAFAQKRITWEVCVPELVPLQNKPPADGLDGYQEEIVGRPTAFRWTWFRS